MPSPRSPTREVSQRSAQQPAEIAHRVLAMDAGPVGERRTREEDRAGEIRPDRAIIMICQPAWQLPMSMACRRLLVPLGDFSTKRASARQTSSIVCPGTGPGRKPTK